MLQFAVVWHDSEHSTCDDRDRRTKWKYQGLAWFFGPSQDNSFTGFMMMQRAELEETGHTILHGTSDTLIATASIHKVASKPHEYPGIKVRERYEIIICTLPGEELPDEEVIWS